MAKRKIVKIDEAKCNGCGECIPNCQEGAIQIIDNKARLISDVFCDGLGACIGHCPWGAILIEERDAEGFDEKKVKEHVEFSHTESELRTWPVQIMLVPENAPYFDNADLLIAADCLPFAYADFHQDLLKGKVLLVGCPKLDDAKIYQEKISRVLKQNNLKSVTYAHMEVPCCFGLIAIIRQAIIESGREIPFKEVIISIKGERIK
jgi:ferredoxin